MTVSIKVEGLAELDRALADLVEATSSATGKAVLRRVLKKAGEPIAEAARAIVPVRTGELRDSIIVSTRIRNRVGAAEYSSVLRDGGTREEAVDALIAARRKAKGEGATVEMYVGPTDSRKGSLVEFGTVHAAPVGFMRGGFEAGKDAALDVIKSDMAGEISKAAERAARRKARKAARG